MCYIAGLALATRNLPASGERAADTLSSVAVAISIHLLFSSTSEMEGAFGQSNSCFVLAALSVRLVRALRTHFQTKVRVCKCSGLLVGLYTGARESGAIKTALNVDKMCISLCLVISCFGYILL